MQGNTEEGCSHGAVELHGEQENSTEVNEDNSEDGSEAAEDALAAVNGGEHIKVIVTQPREQQPSSDDVDDSLEKPEDILKRVDDMLNSVELDQSEENNNNFIVEDDTFVNVIVL